MDELEQLRLGNLLETQEDHERVIILDAMLALRDMMDEDRDPNSPRNVAYREQMRIYMGNGMSFPRIPLPTYEEIQPVKHSDPVFPTKRDRHSGAAAQRRDARARKRRK